MHRVLIVDDESRSRSMLLHALNKQPITWEWVGEADSVPQAKSLIQEQRPALVFLDIDLGSSSGFDLLDQFPDREFSVIFYTAFSSFALKAFRYAALDYLVKPVVQEDLSEALARFAGGNMKPNQQATQAVRSALSSKKLETIMLSTMEELIPVKVDDIVLLHGSGNYTDFHLANGGKETVSKPVLEFQELLPDQQFVRVHQSYLINMDHVERYFRRDGGLVIMKNKTEIPLARRRKDHFLKLLQQR